MLEIIVQLLLSWLILRFAQKQNLSKALGFYPIKKRVIQFLVGFLLASISIALIEIIQSDLTHLSWRLNDKVTYLDIPNYLWWNIKSVLFEELIFRGALLYIVIQRLGPKVGIILSGICFGIYHWFSFGLLGNIVSMTVVFLMTGFMGLVWALGFWKSKSVALTVGLHLGWNFTTNAIFSKGPMGQQILISVKGLYYTPLTQIQELIFFMGHYIGIPLLTYLFIRLYFTETKAIDRHNL